MIILSIIKFNNNKKRLRHKNKTLDNEMEKMVNSFQHIYARE